MTFIKYSLLVSIYDFLDSKNIRIFSMRIGARMSTTMMSFFFFLPRPGHGHWRPEETDVALMARQLPPARNPLRDNAFYDKQIQTWIIPFLF